MIRVAIADDHSILRTGLEKLISEEIDISVIGSASTSVELFNILEKQECDVVVLDITIPGKSGLEILEDIGNQYPDIKVLMLSMHPAERFAVICLKMGAYGYITKENDGGIIIDAIRQVYQGKKYLPRDVANGLIFGSFSNSEMPLEKLSRREVQIFIKLAAGLTVTETARELCLSKSTVNTHRSRIFEKLNLKSNVDLIHFALKNKYIE